MTVQRFFERVHERSLRIDVTGRRFCVWASISIVVVGLHLVFFHSAFRETWYAPLHFLWVVAGACGVAWWCLRPGDRRWTALPEAATFVVVSCGVSWAVARVPWGSRIAGDAGLPLVGGGLVLVSVFLLAVALFIALSGRAGGIVRNGTLQEGVLRHRGGRS